MSLEVLKQRGRQLTNYFVKYNQEIIKPKQNTPPHIYIHSLHIVYCKLWRGLQFRAKSYTCTYTHTHRHTHNWNGKVWKSPRKRTKQALSEFPWEHDDFHLGSCLEKFIIWTLKSNEVQIRAHVLEIIGFLILKPEESFADSTRGNRMHRMVLGQ